MKRAVEKYITFPSETDLGETIYICNTGNLYAEKKYLRIYRRDMRSFLRE